MSVLTGNIILTRLFLCLVGTSKGEVEVVVKGGLGGLGD